MMIPVTIYQQINDYTCGPAALLTAISAFREVPANLTEQALIDALKTSKEKGTPNDKMVAVARDLGFSTETGTGGTLETLKKQIGENRRPVIVVYNDTQNADSFHFAVAVHANEHVIVLADPWTKRFLMHYPDQFQEAWVDSEGTKGWWMTLWQGFQGAVKARYEIEAHNNEHLDYLLLPLSKVSQIGKETGKPVDNGITKFRSAQGSVRYVYYRDGEIVAALQVMDLKKVGRAGGHVANVFVKASERRHGLATKLFNAAKQDFSPLSVSDDLSDAGRAWKNSIT